jgi:N-alpha-acetyltransferase 35, NatC auxiliary subunit
MSWHLGYPLSQTVFTSVYVEALLMPNPLSIDQARFVRAVDSTSQDQPMHQVLRAYCLGMLKACNYVNERIKSEHFYEVGFSDDTIDEPASAELILCVLGRRLRV